jgi:hypothetical protein
MNSLTEIMRTPQEKEYYQYLLLSIYFYLKHNNYNTTAESLFTEGNLGNVFKFPQEIQEGTSEEENLQKKFILHFYKNSYFQSQENFDLIGDFWNEFWEILAQKMKNTEHSSSPMDKYLQNEGRKLQLSCKFIIITLFMFYIDNQETFHNITDNNDIPSRTVYENPNNSNNNYDNIQN